MIVAIAGATGRLGNRVVARLAAGRVSVRVLTRDPAHARHLAAGATDIVLCDVRDSAATWVRLLAALPLFARSAS